MKLPCYRENDCPYRGRDCVYEDFDDTQPCWGQVHDSYEGSDDEGDIILPLCEGHCFYYGTGDYSPKP